MAMDIGGPDAMKFRKSSTGLPDPVTQTWIAFFQNCFARRIRNPEFHSWAQKRWDEARTSGSNISEALLHCQRSRSTAADPLFTVYFEDLLLSQRVQLAEVLTLLLAHSKYSQSKQPIEPWNSAALESTLFLLLSRQILTGNAPRYPHQVRELLKALCFWLRAIGKYEHILIDQHATAISDAVGVLAIAVMENPTVGSVLARASDQTFLGWLSQSVELFATVWQQVGSQVQNSERLLLAANNCPDMPQQRRVEDKKTKNLAQAVVEVQSVPQLSIIPTRPAMYIFLSSLTFARPLSENGMILAFLQAQYKMVFEMDSRVDVESLAVDLIVGAFDILACAVSRKEPESSIFTLKSYLINKIPTLLTTLATAMFSTDRPEWCVGQALSRIDPNVFPTLAFGMMNETPLQDVRQEFLFSCRLHSLLGPGVAETLLGETTTFSQPPDPAARYDKESLIEQCSVDSEKTNQIIEELDRLNGNAGPISTAIAELICTFCVNKDTMAIKSICNVFSGNPRLLDVLTQFVSPTSLLQPLGQLLDGWRYEEDQGEYQPAYEEFSAVFLFVLVIIYRYDIPKEDINLGVDSFIIKWLEEGTRVPSPDKLDEDQRNKISRWIKGLFNPDSIDEALSSCQPQEFFLLAQTIFHYITQACLSNVIPADSLKTPLECKSSTYPLK